MLWAALLALSLPARAAEVCPRLFLEGGDVALSDAEKRLVCGDEKSAAWSRVPASQAERFMRAFLQTRGYHEPAFAVEGETMRVRVGTRSVVSEFVAQGLPPDVDPGKQRRIVGEVLTPRLLDDAKAALAAELQERGYACPEIGITANPRTGRVEAVAEPGAVLHMGRIRDPDIEGVDERVFRRYEAFLRGRPLDQRLLKVTADRIVREALFLSAYYEVECSTGEPVVSLRAVAAPPQLIRVGVGVDTEDYARARAQWKHSRIGGRASSMETTMQASYRQQSFESLLKLYPGPASRAHLQPRLYGLREDETRYEAIRAEASLSPVLAWDDASVGVEAQAGPSVEYLRTVRGLGAPDETFLSLETRVTVLSHIFERYLSDPRSGWQARLETSSRLAGAYSDITAHRARLSAQKLWNAGDYEPALVVIGARAAVAATWVADFERTLALLPPSYRHFMGGDADYRGVGRKELPGEEVGYLTAAYQGLEVRLGDWLPKRLQPFVFIDSAMGGTRHFQLSPDLYYAPGLGLRWPSPIGTIRTSLARGMVWHRDPGTAPVRPRFQFFFSFGREF